MVNAGGIPIDADGLSRIDDLAAHYGTDDLG